MQKKSTKTLPANPTPPPILETIQEWMGDMVSAPSFDKKKTKEKKKANHFLTASNKLSSEERLNIYINDYWPRCIDSLAEDFPGLQHLLGEAGFETWMEKYLTQFPSHHFTLFYLGEDLFSFMETHYHDSNKALVLDCITYEWAKSAAYFLGEDPPFNPETLSEAQKNRLPQLALQLQPFVLPIALNYDLPKWSSKEFEKEPKKRDTYAVIFRQEYQVKEQLISHAFYKVLLQLKSKNSLENTLDTVMASLPEKDHRYLEDNLFNWFKLCVQKGWIRHPKK